MRTGLVRKYGERNTVQQYIDIAVKHLGCSNRVRNTALEMFNHVAQNTQFSGRYPSMLAMALVNLAAIKKNQAIPTKEWSGICSYNTLLKHSNELNDVLQKDNRYRLKGFEGLSDVSKRPHNIKYKKGK